VSWSASPGADQYYIYIWSGGGPRPGTNTAAWAVSGNARETYDPFGLLDDNTEYQWQVVAKYGGDDYESPVWSFTTSSSLLIDLDYAFSFDDAALADTVKCNFPVARDVALTYSGSSLFASATDGLVGGRIGRTDGTVAQIYLGDADVANSNSLTWACFYRLPGIASPYASIRNPFTLRSFPGSGAARLHLQGPYISANETDILFFRGYSDSTGLKTASFATIANISEIQNWFLTAIRFDGDIIKYDIITNADQYSAVIDLGAETLPPIANNRLYTHPATSTMNCTTIEQDGFVTASRPWSDAELLKYWNSGAGRQYPFA
jgi:hypothetical protein